MTEAVRAYCLAALDMAIRRNVLEITDRAAMAGAIAGERESDSLSWASLVVLDMSARCRSFILPELVELQRLGRECGAL